MATRGFEFAYMLDGSNATPMSRDFVLGAAAAHKIGDLMVVQSDGYIDAATTGTTEVTCIMAEAFDASDVTAGTTLGKAWIIARNQVWKCSTDASTAATALIGAIKQWDTVDANTIDASDVNSGAMIVVGGAPAPEDLTNNLDKDGNVVGYVVFADTSFGNT